MEQQLLVICRKFIKDQEITCPECICQMDGVLEDAPDFIEQICNLVGYWDYETSAIVPR